MLQHTGRANTHEYGVSEVIGAVMLIAVVSAAIAVIAVVMLSQPAPEKIPALEAVISNTGDAVQIFHNGGDVLQKEDFKVLVDGAEVPESVLWPAGSDNRWSSGETLTFGSPNAQTVQIVYTKGTTAAAVLSSANFGGVAGNSTLSLTITAAAGPGGSISPSGVISVPFGGSQAFIITPDDGYRIATVLVDGNSIAVVSTYTFSTVTSSHSIYVTFAKNPVITASAGEHGSISPGGPVSVNYAGDQTFTIAPDSGYHITDVLVDTVSQGAITTYNFTNVMEDHTISATFAMSTYSINATAGSNGVINPVGETAVIYGGSQEFIITPDAQYHVADVLVDSISQGSISSYTFTNVAADHTISATFAINTFTITASSGANGAVTPAGTTTVNYGSTPTYNITPNTGYHVVDVLVNGTTVGPVTSYTFPAVDTNKTIEGTFAINTYTITASSGANGAVTPAGTTTVNYGDTPTYNITPNTGYHVVDVLVNGTSVGPVTSYTFPSVTGDKTISATFAINTYTIAASYGANGVVTPTGTTTVNYGDTPTYAITPNTGYHVVDVLVNGTSVGAVTGYTFPAVTTNKTISATFAINTYTITPSIVNGNGTISPATVQTVNYGDTPTFTFAPSTGYHLNTVTVNGTTVTPTMNSYTFPAVTTNKTISVTFAINTYTITPSIVNGNGTISPATVQTVNYGDTPTFTFAPSTGYHLNTVTVNGTTVTPTGNSYTFPAVTTNKTIVGTFAINTYTIVASSGANGAVTPAGTTTVNYGATPTYTITPNTGYHVVDVQVNSTSVGAVTGYTFPAVTTNKTISATFAINQYTINATAGPNGSITPGNTTVNYGGSQLFTITPNTGYHIASVLVDNVSNGTVSSYNFTNVVANHTISATFAINTYSLNATAGSNGSITPGNTTVNYGGSQMFTITPNTGYHVANVLVDNVSNGTVSSYNFTNVAANHTIAATFAINTYSINATAGPNGSITPGNTTVNYGGYQVFTITPNTGYHIANVLVDNVPNGTITSYNFTNVVANHTITATFDRISPVAKFNATPVSGYAPLTVAFTDQSTLSITAWNWSFGDGNFSSVQNPTYIYQSPGNYSVSLNVTNASGSSNLTKNDYIWVTQMPFVNYVIENDVFVYGDQLSFTGATVSGPDATVILTDSLTTSDLNGGTSIAVHTIYVNGDVTLNGGSAGLGSSTNPGNIYVTGDMSLLNGKRDIYGDVYILGNFNLKDARIHGNVYVDGDVTLMWTPTLDTNSHIYYTGTLTIPGNYPTEITSKCIYQPTVPGFTMPSQAIPSVKSDAWYAARGYVPSGALADNLKIFANSYSSSSWSNTVSNVVIIAKTGDISITGLGGSGLRGVLFAPNGKVTFNGGFFEGVVIARDGFDVTSGGTTVTFTNLADYFSSSDDYPF